MLATTLASPSGRTVLLSLKGDLHRRMRRSSGVVCSIWSARDLSAGLPAHAHRRLSIRCDRRLQHGASAYGRSIISTLVCRPANVLSTIQNLLSGLWKDDALVVSQGELFELYVLPERCVQPEIRRASSPGWIAPCGRCSQILLQLQKYYEVSENPC